MKGCEMCFDGVAEMCASAVEYGIFCTGERVNDEQED